MACTQVAVGLSRQLRSGRWEWQLSVESWQPAQHRWVTSSAAAANLAYTRALW